MDYAYNSATAARKAFLVVAALLAGTRALVASELYPFFSSRELQWGYLDSCFNVAIKPSFARAWAFNDGLANVVVNRRVVFIDQTGRVVVDLPNLESSSGSFREGRLNYQVETGNKFFGFLSKTGTFVIDPQFDRAHPYSEGLAAVSKGGKWFFIDMEGKKAFACDFEDAGSFSEGFAWVRRNGMVGFINRQGEFLVPPNFESAQNFQEGMAAVSLHGKWGFISAEGKVVIAPRFDNVGSFSEGLAAVHTGASWGYIDKSGQFVIEPRLGFSGEFHEGLASVVGPTAFKSGYIDRLGVVKIPFSFAIASPFTSGVAMVVWPERRRAGGVGSAHGLGNSGYIDHQGTVIWTVESGRSATYKKNGCPAP